MQSSKTKAVLLFLLALTFGVLTFGGYILELPHFLWVYFSSENISTN